MAQSPNIYLSLLLLKSSSKEKPFLTLRLVRTLLRVDQFRRPLDATLVRSIHLGFLGAAVATRAAAGPGFNQRASSLQIKPRKTKEFQGKMLGFPWISLADSGLFNGLRAKKVKFFARSHNSRLRLCATGLKRFPVLVPSPASALPRPLRGAALFPAAKDKIA